MIPTMLSQKDLDEIDKIVDKKIKYLPTKDDFYTKITEVMGELKAIREEQAVITGKTSVINSQDRGFYEETYTAIAHAMCRAFCST